MMKKVSFLWVIVAAVAPVIAWGLLLIFGTGGMYWESGRLNLATIREVREIREKMTGILQEIETKTMDPSSAVYKRKVLQRPRQNFGWFGKANACQIHNNA